MYKRYRQEWTKHLDFIIVEEISLQIAYVLAMWLRFREVLYGEGIYRELGFVLFLIDFVVVMSINSMHNVLKRGFFIEFVETLKIVGTRPPTVDEWEKYEYHHRARLTCKPGITGLWQISGRSLITDFEEVVKLDTKYIDEWSMSLDIKLVFKTIRLLVAGDEGAM